MKTRQLGLSKKKKLESRVKEKNLPIWDRQRSSETRVVLERKKKAVRDLNHFYAAFGPIIELHVR